MVVSKEQLRKEMLEQRNMQSPEEILEKSKAIRDKLFALPEFKQAKTIAFYITKGSEADTKEMINTAMAQGKKVLVPVTKEEVELVEFVSWDDLKPGKYGILEPGGTTIAKQEPEVVIVPGVAFDEHGHRIGYGKGYYDRLLKKLKSIRIGICFDSQIVDKIPNTEQDEKLNFIITERRIFRIKS